jgi:ubiquinone/menaquinone biosynthesis C-methylase UbiE/uncharacterized protein YbaR (Trm112 family)
MSNNINETREWLDRRYSRDESGAYFAHQPIYGFDSERSEPNAVQRLARTYRLLNLFEGLQFDSALDIGGGEGYLSALIRDLAGAARSGRIAATPLAVHCSDISVEACLRAREIFEVPGVATDAMRLPFLDNSYDLVICSEVIEHLPQPVLAISELVRVARKYVVITTEEFCSTGGIERELRLCELDRSYPHSEYNWFTASDFRALLGEKIFVGSQLYNPGFRATQFFSQTKLNESQARKAIQFLTQSGESNLNHSGVIVIAAHAGAEVDRNIVQSGPLKSGRQQHILERLMTPFPPVTTTQMDSEPVDPGLLERLGCLLCRGALNVSEEQLVCADCGHRYPLENGVPVMFVETAAPQAISNAITILSGNESQRVQGIRQVIKKLHGKRPLYSGNLIPSVAEQLLRVVWFLRRPESIGHRLNRITRRLSGKPPIEIERIKQDVFGNQ